MGATTGIPMASHSTVVSFVRHLTEAQLALPEAQGLHGAVSTGAGSPTLLYALDAKRLLPVRLFQTLIQMVTFSSSRYSSYCNCNRQPRWQAPWELLPSISFLEIEQQGESHVANGATKYGETDAEVSSDANVQVTLVFFVSHESLTLSLT
jgi:hypothetical protein